MAQPSAYSLNNLIRPEVPYIASGNPEDNASGNLSSAANPGEGSKEEDEIISEELQRLTIPYLRKQKFPGSDIQINESIASYAKYNSYIASYVSEGNKINGLLTVPKTKMPEGGYPAVVFLHGYIPPQIYKTTERYEEYVATLARAGLVVFKIDYRGHGSSDGLPRGAYHSSDYIFDTLNARASLAKLHYVNKDKIGLWGHSMSGNILLRSMAVRPQIKVGVIWAGAVYTYTDLLKYDIQDSSYKPDQVPDKVREERRKMRARVGRVFENKDFWKKVAPTSYLSELEGYVEIHHSVSDGVVPIGYSRNVSKLLQEAGIEHNLYEYETGGHNLRNPAFKKAMERSIEAFGRM